MSVEKGKLPLLDPETLRFPERFWPPTLAKDAKDARDAAGEAVTSATDAGLSAASAAAAISSTSWSGSVSLTPTPGGLIHATLTGDTTLELVDLDPAVAVSVNLLVTQDATGGHKLTVPYAKAAYGVMPKATGSAGASDVWTLLWDGTDWTVFVGAQNLLIPMGWVI